MNNDFLDIFYNSISLLLSGNKELWEIVLVSLRVSIIAITIVFIPSVVTAFLLKQYNNKLSRFIVYVIHTLTSMPAVVVGLIVYLLLSNQGVFSDLNWLFTQKAMIIGQILLAFPIIVNIIYGGLNTINKEAYNTAITLGANRVSLLFTIIFEIRFIVIGSVVSAFGRIIAEIGSAIMVGGNILHHTRSITTAIALETSKGEFVLGIALGIILLIFAFMLNFLILIIGRKY